MSKVKKCQIPIMINIPTEVLISYNEVRNWINHCDDATTLRNLASLMNSKASRLED